MDRRSRGSWRLALACSIVLLAAGVLGAGAATDPTTADEDCYACKLKGARCAVKYVSRCYKKYTRSGDDAEFAACVSAVDLKVTAKIARVDTKLSPFGYSCPGTPESLGLVSPVSWARELLEDAVLQSNSLPNICVGDRAVALTKYASKYTTCYSKNFGIGPALAAECATKAAAVFLKKWGVAESRGSCTSDTLASVQAAVESVIDAQAASLLVACGDGSVGGYEQCDDGNATAEDGCENDCTASLVCGNGFLQAANGEECDDGNTAVGDGCDESCILEVCGNGVVQTGNAEQCDDGGESAECDADCSVAGCGDGTINTMAGESCDDAGQSATCDTDCSPAVCGDGTVNAAAGESCDDGGESAACDADCTAVTCGDGTANASAGEQCDDGGPSSGCDGDCSLAVCGDGTYNPLAGEQCDDGGESAGCDADCSLAVCGDGTWNATAGESCDDGGASAACDTDCTPALCGDGTWNAAAGESCDDGGQSAVCDTDCTPAVCGDGTWNATAGESCDDGGESASCDADCTPVACGDGAWNATAGESCDDGGQSASCDADCTPAVCGDGTWNATAGEACDDGGESAVCDADCSPAVCGDGTWNATAGEVCDDGGESATCDTDCTRSTCGDWTVNASAAEECDDGDNVDGDGCSFDCMLEDCTVFGQPDCLVCPFGSSPDPTFTTCVCDPGFVDVGGACEDVDECALGTDACGATPCVNVPGSYSCATACTQAAFEAAIDSCGAPTGVITFDCTDTTILIDNDLASGPRSIGCNGLVIDGLDRNIAFELDPACFEQPVSAGDCQVERNPDGTCDCPGINGGTYFLRLNGDDITVRNLTVRYFFEGIRTRGTNNTVERVTFVRHCDDAFGNDPTGVGNLFRDSTVTLGCDKCSQNYGNMGATVPETWRREHYNAIFSSVDFTDCMQPLRMTESGRYLVEGSRFVGNYATGLFRCFGPRFNADASGTVVVHFQNSTIDNCAHGLRFGQNTEALVSGNTIMNDDFRGVQVKSNARASFWDNVVIDNGGVGSSDPGLGGIAVIETGEIDLGGGSLSIDGEWITSPGNNTLCGNVAPNGSAREVDNLTTQTVRAENNYWCTSDPSGIMRGDVDYLPFLTSPPQ